MGSSGLGFGFQVEVLGFRETNNINSQRIGLPLRRWEETRTGERSKPKPDQETLLALRLQGAEYRLISASSRPANMRCIECDKAGDHQ